MRFRLALLVVAALLAIGLVAPAAAQATDYYVFGGISYYDPTYVPGSAPGPMITDPAFTWFGQTLYPDDVLTVVLAWYGYGKGLAQSLPNVVDASLTVDLVRDGNDPEPIVAVSATKGREHWTGPYLVTDPEPLADWPPFNPNLGAKLYVNYWYLTLPPLEEGTYYAHFVVSTTHTSTDLCGGYYDGQRKPVMFKPMKAALDAYFRFQVIPAPAP